MPNNPDSGLTRPAYVPSFASFIEGIDRALRDLAAAGIHSQEDLMERMRQIKYEQERRAKQTR